MYKNIRPAAISKNDDVRSNQIAETATL